MKRGGFSFLGACLFFVTIALCVTASVIVYSAISDRQGWEIALIMLTVVISLSAIATLADFLRRKFIIERAADEISTAAEIMAKGNFSIRLTPRHPYGKYDEYDRIMENLNLLAEELSKTEILRNDFISNVSHELKTPLAVISSYASALRGGGLDKETQEKYLDTLVSTSKRLSRLVVNILKLNKLENSSIPTDVQKFDLAETLRECILGYEEVLDSKNLELDCDIDEAEINSDKSFLETVFNNLISNAVKFTPEGGKISISLKNNGGKVVVKVEDTGCGIDPQTGAHIFDKFYQGDTSHSSEGNGLGLAMVKRVIDILGGEISVQSQIGKGSTFTVVLNPVV